MRISGAAKVMFIIISQCFAQKLVKTDKLCLFDGLRLLDKRNEMQNYRSLKRLSVNLILIIQWASSSASLLRRAPLMSFTRA